MIITEILDNPLRAYLLEERLVNDGLPGGMHFLNNTSKETNPWLVDRFTLPVIRIHNEHYTSLSDYSSLNDEERFFIQMLGEDSIPIHPDILEKYNAIDRYEVCETVDVSPTASSRTVYCNDFNIFLKLDYPYILGRVNKALTRNDCISSYENSIILREIEHRGEITDKFSFLPEKYNRTGTKYAFIMRSSPFQTEDSILIPAFSLFGDDARNYGEPCILKQLCDARIGVGKDFVNELIFPIIDVYLQLLFYEGMLAEMHAQNLLLRFDRDFKLQKIILRDIDSIQRDLEIMKDRNKEPVISNLPYRCIIQDQYDKKIKRSFMFDHKLGDFLLSPLLSKVYGNDEKLTKKAQNRIAEYCRNNYRDLFESYFPKEHWYQFCDISVDKHIRRRVYTERDNLIYR